MFQTLGLLNSYQKNEFIFACNNGATKKQNSWQKNINKRSFAVIVFE